MFREAVASSFRGYRLSISARWNEPIWNIVGLFWFFWWTLNTKTKLTRPHFPTKSEAFKWFLYCFFVFVWPANKWALFFGILCWHENFLLYCKCVESKNKRQDSFLWVGLLVSFVLPPPACDPEINLSALCCKMPIDERGKMGAGGD